MPCCQVRTVNVQFGEKTHLESLKKAMEENGYLVSIHGENLRYSHNRSGLSGVFYGKAGQFEHRDGYNFEKDKIAESYQKFQTIHNAEEAGWHWEQDENDKNKIHLFREQ